MKQNLPDMEARRESLALDLFVKERTGGGDLRQGFCCAVACGLDYGVPGPAEFAEVPRAEQNQFLAARARVLAKVGAGGGKWLAGMCEGLKEESRSFANGYGESDWFDRTDSLGLSREDFFREVLVCALVLLSVPPEVHPSRAGRGMVPKA